MKLNIKRMIIGVKLIEDKKLKCKKCAVNCAYFHGEMVSMTSFVKAWGG